MYLGGGASFFLSLEVGLLLSSEHHEVHDRFHALNWGPPLAQKLHFLSVALIQQGQSSLVYNKLLHPHHTQTARGEGEKTKYKKQKTKKRERHVSHKHNFVLEWREEDSFLIGKRNCLWWMAVGKRNPLWQLQRLWWIVSQLFRNPKHLHWFCSVSLCASPFQKDGMDGRRMHACMQGTFSWNCWPCSTKTSFNKPWACASAAENFFPNKSISFAWDAGITNKRLASQVMRTFGPQVSCFFCYLWEEWNKPSVFPSILGKLRKSMPLDFVQAA